MILMIFNDVITLYIDMYRYDKNTKNRHLSKMAILSHFGPPGALPAITTSIEAYKAYQ